MVGEIKRNYLSGTKLVTEKRPTWRDSGINAVVNSVAGAVEAGNNYFEREKQLVWKRLNLEAANLQTEELNAIKTAKSIDEIPGIVENFQKKLKDNMRGQKWGKEWMENLGSGFLSYNKQDVQNAFRAKEKELAGISLNETLKAYADQVAAAPEDEAAFFSADADKLIDADTYLTPTEKQKAKENLSDLIKNKRLDLLRQEKYAREQQKLKNETIISELTVKAADGVLTREELEENKKNGLFMYAPEKYSNLVEKLNKKDEDFTGDEATIQQIKDNWGKMTERQLQEFEHKGLISPKLYNHYSAQLSKLNSSSGDSGGKDNSVALALYDRARGGEDVIDEATRLNVGGEIKKEQLTKIEEAYEKAKGRSLEFKEAWQKIGAGEIKDDADISNMNIPENEKDALKKYIGEVVAKNTRIETDKKNIINKSYDDLSKLAANNEINEAIAEADPNWRNFTAEQQKDLLSGIRTARETAISKAVTTGKDLILRNNLTDADIEEYVLNHNLPSDKAEELRKYAATVKNDKAGIFTSAVEFGRRMLSAGDSPAEVKARENFENYVQSEYQRAVDAGKTPADIQNILSQQNLLNYIFDNKPTERQVLESVNTAALNVNNIDAKIDEIAPYDKKLKKRVYDSGDIAPIVDISQQLDAALAKGKISQKEYEKRKSELAPAMVEALNKMEQEIGTKTLVGDMYREVAGRIGEDNLSVDERAGIIDRIMRKAAGASIPFDASANWWAKTQSFFGGETVQKTLADKYGYNIFAPGEIVSQVIKEEMTAKYPNMPMEQIQAVADGNKLVYVPEMETVANTQKQIEEAIQKRKEGFKQGADKVDVFNYGKGDGKNLTDMFKGVQAAKNGERQVTKDGKTYIFKDRNS